MQTVFAQEEPSPDQHADVDREERVAEEGSADAHLAGDSPAQVASWQDRAQNRGARNGYPVSPALGIGILSRLAVDKALSESVTDGIRA